MKHLLIYKNNVNPSSTYDQHLQEMVMALNASATFKRTAGEPSHQAERTAIIQAIMNDFPDKTEENIVVNLINTPRISPNAVDDYIFFHHRSFRGNKACLIPKKFPAAVALGLHIVRRIKSSFFTGSGLDVVNNKIIPQTDIGYYNDENQEWVTFRLADTDLYRATKEYEEACITNGLQFKGGRNSEFSKVVDYIGAYQMINAPYVPSVEQFDFLGWNKDKTRFISPRRKDCYINMPDEVAQEMINEGYVQKGNDPAQNVNGILNILKAHPLAVAIYACSYINALSAGSIIDSNYLVLDIHGFKGTGKNLLQYTAMNPIGKSEEKSTPLLQTWVGASNAGLLANIRSHRSHPVFFDDAQMNDIKTLEDIGYITFNSSRGVKSKTDGVARNDKNTTSMVVSTGEASILSIVKKDGLTRRILPLPMDRVLEKIINNPGHLRMWQKQLGSLLNKSYGIALDPLVDYALENKETLKTKYEKYSCQYIANNEDRHFDCTRYESYAKYVAGLHVVLESLCEKYQLSALNQEEIDDICSYVDQYLREICIENKNIEALEATISYASTNFDKHFQGRNQNHPQYGKFAEIEMDGAKKQCLVFVTSELEGFLTSTGYVVANVLAAWEGMGVIRSKIINKGGGRTSRVKSFKYALKNTGSTSIKPYCTYIFLEPAQQIIDQINGTSEILDTTPSHSTEQKIVQVNFKK